MDLEWHRCPHKKNGVDCTKPLFAKGKLSCRIYPGLIEVNYK